MRRVSGSTLALAGVVVGALALRLWSIGHGLPHVYNADEELHFVPVAVDMFGGSFNPGYFENPPALTYLLHLVFRLRFTEGFPFGGGDFRRTFLDDPEAAYLTARVVVALIGTAVVAIVYWVGARYYERRVGLAAAVVMAVAFLPVFYSHFALNDVVTMAPVAAALVGALRIWERGRPLDWALAGAAVGCATAVKYTAGAALIVVGVAALCRLLTKYEDRRDDLRTLVRHGVVAAVAFGVVYALLNPYSLLDFSEFKSQLGGQSDQASGAKLGQEDVPGWIYYVWTFTWGFGWLPLVAALAGGVLAVRDCRVRGWLLLAFPIVLFLFLGSQGRFFGRWLLPIYPALCVLAGLAAVRAADALAARARVRALVPLAVVLLALAAQGVTAAVHTGVVLGREDTREQMRDWLAAHVPAGTKVVVEPFLPRGFLTTGGREAPERYRRWEIPRPFQGYTRRLTPGLLDEYRRAGYCTVVTASHQRDRGLSAGLRGARDYYERLERESRLVRYFSPYEPGAEPVDFNFDLSFNYLPSRYERPGPVIAVYELNDCSPS